MRVRKAVFPVGGLGTRFLPATKALPKEMLPIVDKPLIQYAVEEASAAGIEEFIFVTGRGKITIEDHFDHSYELEELLSSRGKIDELTSLRSVNADPGHFFYTRQQEPRGLGHAVWCARRLVGDEPFAVVLADDLILSDTPCLKQLTDAAKETGGNMVAVMDVPRKHSSRYGILDVASDNGLLAEIKGLVEKPNPDKAPSTLSVVGRYILTPDVFDHLEKMEQDTGDEIQLTDAMAKMVGDRPFHGLRFRGTRFDCGDKLGFLKATVAVGLARSDLREGFEKYLSSIGSRTKL